MGVGVGLGGSIEAGAAAAVEPVQSGRDTSGKRVESAEAITRTREAVYNAYLNRNEFVSGGSAPPNWTEDGKGFWFAEGAPDDTAILRVDLDTGKTAPMFAVAKVRAAIAAATSQEPPYRGLPFDQFTRAKDGRVEFSYNGARWLLDPATYDVEPLKAVGLGSRLQGAISEAERLAPRTWKRGGCSGYLIDKVDVPEQLSHDGQWFAGIQDDNIVLRSTHDNREQRLTTCGTADCYWDIESVVYGRLQGRLGQLAARTVAPWSPDDLTLLAYRRDITGVFRIPRIHWLKSFEEVDYQPLQKAGGKLDCVQPVFVDVRSGKQVPVALPQIEDRYIQWLGWYPSGSEALCIVYTRDIRRLDIFAADRTTGAVRLLLAESAATAVKNQQDEVWSCDHGFHLLPDNGFLWLSTRSGWNHLYRHDANGKRVGQLTSGNWPVYEVTRVGAGFVYFIAAIDAARPYDLHVCRVALKGGKVEQLTREKGIHSAVFAPSGQAFLDTHSAVDRPVRTDLVRADGTRMRVVSEMDISRLEAWGYTAPEEFTVKAADGVTDLWGVMYKPFDFDPARSYPVIESIYGGPQAIWAQRFFAVTRSRYMNAVWAFAQLGYVTIMLDGRGTPGRSKAFQDFVHGRLKAGIKDHAAAIRQLCARHSWLDANRVGIFGASWGGSFSTYALMTEPDTYHAAVSHEPSYDPWHSIMYEPYLGLPQQNHAAYVAADVVAQAGTLRRPLMIVTGTRYNPCAPTAFKMTRALIEAGIDHELVVVPEATHSFVGAEEDYLLRKQFGWFERHIKNRV